MRGLLVRKPVHKHRHSYATAGAYESAGNVSTSAWTEITASLDQPASAVEIFDSSGRILKISIGTAGNESTNEVPYYIIPGGSGILLPIEFGRTARISVKAVDAAATTGSLVFNFFG